MVAYFFFFKQKTAYEVRISDWSSDVCSSDLAVVRLQDRRLRAQHDPTRRHVTSDAGIHGDEAVGADGREVCRGRIDTHEAALADHAMPGDADVGCDVDMVLDLRPVPQVVAAPDHHVVADLDRRLDGLVLQNEAIVTDTEVRPDDRTRADVRSEEQTSELQSLMRSSYAVS